MRTGQPRRELPLFATVPDTESPKATKRPKSVRSPAISDPSHVHVVLRVPQRDEREHEKDHDGDAYQGEQHAERRAGMGTEMSDDQLRPTRRCN